MFVQWCIKGVWGKDNDFADGIDDAGADDILLRHGIGCNWWRNAQTISPEETRLKLTADALHDHIHNYAAVQHDTPFISLTAGCVDRDAAHRLNRIREAQDVALRFATDWGAHAGYLFHCWVPVGLNPAVEIESIAEEVRELNTYVRWSDYQLEGEITAKVIVPANQIARWERWEPASGAWLRRANWHINPRFDPPERLANLRGVL